MATFETHSNLEDFRKTTKSVSGLIGYILSGILVLVCGCGPSADDMCIEAKKKLLDGKVMEAFHDYSKAIDKDPNSSEAYNGQGNCYYAKSLDDIGFIDINNAVSSYTKAIELDRKNKKPYMNRAQCYAKLGKNLEAYDDASKAIELDPRNSVCHAHRANILFKIGRLDDEDPRNTAIRDAMKDINTAIGMEEGYIDYYRTRYYLYLAKDKLEKSDIDKADEDLEMALKCTKISSRFSDRDLKRMISHLCSVKGGDLDNQGDTKGALEWFSKSISENEKYFYPYKLRSLLYKREGKIKESNFDLAKANELKEKFPKESATDPLWID